MYIYKNSIECCSNSMSMEFDFITNNKLTKIIQFNVVCYWSLILKYLY